MVGPKGGASHRAPLNTPLGTTFYLNANDIIVTHSCGFLRPEVPKMKAEDRQSKLGSYGQVKLLRPATKAFWVLKILENG